MKTRRNFRNKSAKSRCRKHRYTKRGGEGTNKPKTKTNKTKTNKPGIAFRIPFTTGKTFKFETGTRKTFNKEKETAATAARIILLRKMKEEIEKDLVWRLRGYKMNPPINFNQRENEDNIHIDYDNIKRIDITLARLTGLDPNGILEKPRVMRSMGIRRK